MAMSIFKDLQLRPESGFHRRRRLHHRSQDSDVSEIHRRTQRMGRPEPAHHPSSSRQTRHPVGHDCRSGG